MQQRGKRHLRMFDSLMSWVTIEEKLPLKLRRLFLMWEWLRENFY